MAIYGLVRRKQRLARLFFTAERILAVCDGDLNFFAVPHCRLIVDRRSQFFCLTQRCLFIRLRQNYAELITAKPADHIRMAHMLQQHISLMHQRGVPGRLAKFVIDGLHVIDVKKRQDRRL